MDDGWYGGRSATAHECYQLETIAGIESTVCQPRPRHHRFIYFNGERSAREPQSRDQVGGCRARRHFARLSIDDDGDFHGFSYFGFAPAPRGWATSSSTKGVTSDGCCTFQGMP